MQLSRVAELNGAHSGEARQCALDIGFPHPSVRRHGICTDVHDMLIMQPATLTMSPDITAVSWAGSSGASASCSEKCPGHGGR